MWLKRVKRMSTIYSIGHLSGKLLIKYLCVLNDVTYNILRSTEDSSVASSADICSIMLEWNDPRCGEFLTDIYIKKSYHQLYIYQTAEPGFEVMKYFHRIHNVESRVEKHSVPTVYNYRSKWRSRHQAILRTILFSFSIVLFGCWITAFSRQLN